MIGTRPIGIAPIGVLGSEQANEYVGTGGAQSGGTADVQAGFSYNGTGGAQAGGSADVQVGIAYTGTGGAQSGGASIPSYEYVGTGGAQSGGTADVVYTQVVPTQSISGSIRVQTVEQSIHVQLLSKAA